ncbi:MAG: endo,3(4)-beta-glucanase, partial [Anaerocolumna sp.]|nr:endo,3(4)-beta-glucanase [Anaerocolumna sp.]
MNLGGEGMKSRRKGLACLLVLSLIVSIIFPSGSMISYAADQSSTIATTSSSDTIGVNDVSVQATKELIKNGDFSQGAQDWGIIKENNADITIVPGKATVTVTGGAITADWMPSLHQVVSLDAGTNYRISVELESSVDRNIMIAKDSERTYSNPDDQKSLKANQKTTISYETGVLTEAIPEFKLMIYCGILPGDSFYGNHTLTITKVSMIALPVTLPDDPCDELPSPIADITGISPTDALVLKNGDFSKGLSNWETYAVDWMQQYDVVKYTKVENGMNVYIKNVGSDPGNNNYDVQLYQAVNLKKDLQYSISFDVHSDKARSIQVVYDGVGFLKTIGIQAGETRHVTYN